MLLVKVHPSLLRLIAPEARVWIEKSWKRWTKDNPNWFTDRWKRGLPDSVLSQQVRKRLGGQNRRRSTLSEQVAGPRMGAVSPPTRAATVAAASLTPVTRTRKSRIYGSNLRSKSASNFDTGELLEFRVRAWILTASAGLVMPSSFRLLEPIVTDQGPRASGCRRPGHIGAF